MTEASFPVLASPANAKSKETFAGREKIQDQKDFQGVFYLHKNSGNFGGNFHRVKNVFYLTQVRSPPSDCDFTRQNLKMWP